MPDAPGPTGGPPIAEPGQRLLARVVDTLLVGVPIVATARALLPEDAADLVTAPALAGALLLYEAVQLALWGRTLGKRFAGITVLIDGPELRGPPPGRAAGLGVARAALRAATHALPIAARPVPVLDVVAGIFWVADAAALLERPRRRALHDRLAGTVVVTQRPT